MGTSRAIPRCTTRFNKDIFDLCEVPAELYHLWLGPRKKYSGCVYPEAGTGWVYWIFFFFFKLSKMGESLTGGTLASRCFCWWIAAWMQIVWVAKCCKELPWRCAEFHQTRLNSICSAFFEPFWAEFHIQSDSLNDMSISQGYSAMILYTHISRIFCYDIYDRLWFMRPPTLRLPDAEERSLEQYIERAELEDHQWSTVAKLEYHRVDSWSLEKSVFICFLLVCLCSRFFFLVSTKVKCEKRHI